MLLLNVFHNVYTELMNSIIKAHFVQERLVIFTICRNIDFIYLNIIKLSNKYI
jgi:hypothetical protein